MSNVVVSNGTDFFEIDATDLSDARAEGFYLPAEQGLVIVTDGRETLEIPLEDLAAAEADGFRAVSTAEDRADLPSEAPPAAAAPLLETAPSEEELRREELTRDMLAATGFPRFLLWCQLQLPSPRERSRLAKTYGAALLLHLLLLIGFSFYVLSDPEFMDGGAIISALTGPSDEIADAEELPQEVVVEPNESADSESTDPSDEIADALADATGDTATAFDPNGVGLDGLSEALEASGGGKASKTSAAFFGSSTVASRFVFVIDNSNSMGGGRFETALNELAKTIVALTKEQSYYILFYSDTAYPIFHPAQVDRMVPATSKNKELTIRWLHSVPMCLRTDAALALQKAYLLEPDVIFVLGDGAFTDRDKVRKVMAARSDVQKKIRIHALGMEVNASAAKNFQELANATGGSYRDVGVFPAAKLLAKQKPRPKLNQRTGVWGLKLPVKK